MGQIVYKHFTPGPCAAQGGKSVRKCWKLWKSWKCWKLLIVGPGVQLKSCDALSTAEESEIHFISGREQKIQNTKKYICSQRGHDATIT